jgi:ubiquinone/menaquinone biosynthesis C-methylase UbiE
LNDRRGGPFEAIQAAYDNLRFVRQPAVRLAEYAQIKPGQRVLDVGCGTGWATMQAALAAGSTGMVTGIDISDKMLAGAREKAAAAGLANIEYRSGDAQQLEFKDAEFDTLICASAIFFLKDIPGALSEWRLVLKVGGRLAFSSFGDRFLQPALQPLGERLARFDGRAPPSPDFLQRTNLPHKCRRLLEDAGFVEIEITTEQLGYYLPDAEAYWQEISSTFVKLRLDKLSPEDLARFKKEHLHEVESLWTDRGLWIELPAHFSVAARRT